MGDGWIITNDMIDDVRGNGCVDGWSNGWGNGGGDNCDDGYGSWMWWWMR